MQTQAMSRIFKPTAFLITHSSIIPTTPTTYLEAFKYSEWRSAMNEEFHTLQEQEQGKWSLVPCLPSMNFVGCK